MRNFSDDFQPTGIYRAREDFQRRDSARLPSGAAQIYRNGDIRAHVLLWESLDAALVPLLGARDFRRPRGPEDYGRWVRFKLEVIAYAYKKWSIQPVIARPIDVLLITRKDVVPV